MASLFSRNGYRITPQAEDADIIVINTCAFILPAKEESIEEILKAIALKKESGKRRSLVVTGCLPQRYRNSLESELPEVDLFLGVSEVPNIVSHCKKLTSSHKPQKRTIVNKPTFLMNASHSRLLSTPFYTAYLKIAEGCSHRCSYCVIPSIRGRARSRPMADILTEAESLVRGGAKELILVAQDTTVYGSDIYGKSTLAELLRNLSALKGIQWIRILYANPSGLTDELLTTIREEKAICHYIDMPVQHIDDDILTTMNRKGGSSLIRDTLQRVRTILPDVAVRTSLIVGFPGETSEKFEKLLEFIKEARFDHLGVFPYSREEQTPAASYSPHIPERIKNARKDVLMREQASISFEINQSLIGTTQEILIEGKSGSNKFPLRGRCRRQAPDIDGITYLRGKDIATGEIVIGEIVSADHYDLYAEIITP